MWVKLEPQKERQLHLILLLTLGYFFQICCHTFHSLALILEYLFPTGVSFLWMKLELQMKRKKKPKVKPNS